MNNKVITKQKGRKIKTKQVQIFSLHVNKEKNIRLSICHCFVSHDNLSRYNTIRVKQ